MSEYPLPYIQIFQQMEHCNLVPNIEAVICCVYLWLHICMKILLLTVTWWPAIPYEELHTQKTSPRLFLNRKLAIPIHLPYTQIPWITVPFHCQRKWVPMHSLLQQKSCKTWKDYQVRWATVNAVKPRKQKGWQQRGVGIFLSAFCFHCYQNYWTWGKLK